jgi:pyruvate dehydrogenase E1 component alpha subunit
MVYFGDGATSQGDVNEAFVFAASANAPVVFFCQNNGWAISEPTSLQSRIPLYRRASGFGFPGVRVDGNDVLAVQAVTEWALDRARRGDGPVLIEAYTYRMGAHTTSDDPGKYRLAAEIEEWRGKDPIERVKAYLLAAGAIDQAWLDALAAESDALAERLRDGCVALPEPVLADAWDVVYANTPDLLVRQRDEYLAYAASFEEVQ